MNKVEKRIQRFKNCKVFAFFSYIILLVASSIIKYIFSYTTSSKKRDSLNISMLALAFCITILYIIVYLSLFGGLTVHFYKKKIQINTNLQR